MAPPAAAGVRGKAATALSGGSLARDQVARGWAQYDAFFTQAEGGGGGGAGGPTVREKAGAPALVDTFYNLVTDIYEWGWGQSFHFSPAVPGASNREATRLHEVRVAALLGLRPGLIALDAGCGVGGPMRAIAAASGAHVVGITINGYQVQRAQAHTAKAGLQHLARAVQGSFLAMPFPAAHFDAAFSIEATCHAPRLQDAYAEILRVLKPGALYASYEWVTTPLYDPADPAHAAIIAKINHGNALPEMRSHAQVVAAAREVGFEVLRSEDLALPPALPWWRRLQLGRLAYLRNHAVVTALSWVGIAPKGLVEVHDMLTTVAAALARAGELGIFTPMHLLLLRKPLDPPAAA
eukprot:SM000099S25241  [mRNA]  locus=s99:506713:507926:+ [translate_table: standard]